MKYKYMEEYESNGERPEELTGDILVNCFYVFGDGGWGSYNQPVSHIAWHLTTKFRIVDERYKPDPNNWYKLGELPPVNSVVEYNTSESTSIPTWVKAKILATNGEWIVFTYCGFERPFITNNLTRFRPFKTEEDEVVDKLTGFNADGWIITKESAKAIAKLGLRLVEDKDD